MRDHAAPAGRAIVYDAEGLPRAAQQMPLFQMANVELDRTSPTQHGSRAQVQQMLIDATEAMNTGTCVPQSGRVVEARLRHARMRG